MKTRTLIFATAVATLLAAASTGALPPSAAAASFASAAPPQDGEVVVPGGVRFISNAAGMRLVTRTAEEERANFLNELAAYLAAPMVLDYSERIMAMVDELRSLEAYIAELDARYPDVVASLADSTTPAYAKATEMLDFLGFRVFVEGERIQLQRRVGDREARQRQMLGYLGVSVPLQSRLWAAGEPVVINISNERVPLLFGAEAWNSQVFEEELDGDALFDALVADPAARRVLAGYAGLDTPTREWLFEQVGLRPLYRDPDVAAGFLNVSPYLRVVDGELHLPGGDRDAWQAILEPWSDSTELITRLVRRDGGRAAHLWRALSLIPERRAAYLLTLGRETAAQRAAWAQTMYRAIRMPDFADAIRWPEDTAELFVNLRLRRDGAGIEWPGGGRVWRAAFDGDDRLRTAAERDALLARFEATPDSGPEVDEPLLRDILRQSEPARDEPSATRELLAVSAAIRYQPIDAMREAIPVLVRNYRRFGRAYSFLVQPAALPEGAAERLVWHLQQIDAIERDEARIDAIRQAQATLMLLQRVLLNDLLTNEDRRALVNSFLDLPVNVVTVGADADLGYGNAIAEWWRHELLPAMTRGLQANGWPGDPADLRSVVVTALTGRIGIAELEVDGIDYSYTPASTLGRRMYTHLLLQQQPSFQGLFRLDEIAVTLRGGTVEPGFADEIQSIVTELRAQMPPNIGDQEVTEALPVTIARDQLFTRSDALVTTLRSGAPTPAQIADFRAAVNAYLGDALVGIVYALNMGDPTSFTYQQGHIAWLHRLIIAELGDDGPEDLFSPWAATSESWILDEGSRLHNSLFGAPAVLARWNVEDLISGGGARDPAAAEAWAATLAYIHLPSLTPEAQQVVAQRHALATTWISEAVAARDPDALPSFWAVVDRTIEPPRLASALRLLMHPDELQRFRDAVVAGRETEAQRLVSDGNRYLLLLGIDDYDRVAPAAARWLVEQTVGMPLGRRGDYLGLMTPPPVPYGEAGDEFADPLLYTRLFDIRVRLAVQMQERGLPSAMHARLLAGTMARILANMVPSNYQPWRNLLAAIDAEVTEATLGQQVVDLAFADELTPTDPNMVLDDLAGDPERAGGPAGRTSTLGLPVDPQQYEAAFGAEVDMVTVDIGAWDEDDNFITDLTLDDIVVTRNGEPVTPAFLRLVGNPEPSIFVRDLPADVAAEVTPTPRNFVLVADMLTTAPQDWERILLDVTEFVRAGIGVTDRLALVTIDSRGIPSVTHDFTLDHERIAETLEAQVGNSFATSDRESSFIDLSVILCDNGGCTSPGEGGDQTLCEPISTPRFFQCVTQQPEWEDFKFRMAQAQLGRWSIEASLNAERVMAAMTQVGSMLDLGDPYDRQKYVILLSSGFERVPGAIHQQIISEYASYSPSLNPMEIRTLTSDLSHKIVDLEEIMKRCRCTVYSLGTLGQSAFTESSAELRFTTPVVSRFAARTSLQDPLNGLARDTGGKPFFGSDLGLGFRDVLQDTRLRYVLGFTMNTPSADAEPQWYDIEVKVNRAGVDEVRARDGFLWPRR